MLLVGLLNAISLCVLQLGTYFVWFSRKNIFNHFSIAFCIVSLIIPSFVVEYKNFTDQSVIYFYTAINAVGAFTYVIGILVGYRVKRISIVHFVINPVKISALSNINDNERLLYQTARKIYFIGIIGMIFSFIVMGFVPMFSSDPVAAKFFKNEYQDSYKRVAFIYRTCKLFIELTLPFLILNIIKKKSIINIVLVVTGFLLLIVSLQRTQMAQSILIALSIYFAFNAKKYKFYAYLLVVIAIYILGSLFYYISAKLFLNSSFDSILVGDNIWDAIAIGAPDIPDHLRFLNSYMHSDFGFTYGLTFIGGLVPFQFKWNPSIWSLFVLNGGDDDFLSIISGGLRLPVTIWGYVSFGWVGVVLLPFFSGLFSGYITRVIKKLMNKTDSTVWLYFFVFVYLNIAVLFINFYTISIYWLPPFLLYFFFLKKFKKSTT
jgi:hypothetical protein